MIVSAQSVTLDFPVHGVDTRSLRRAVLGLGVGGRMGTGADKQLVIRALRNVSFELKEGDRLGLMGHNGSGKSTLLRCLAGIYPPTSGRVVTNGETATFFDVSLGVEGEATGRENVYMLGMYRGKSRREVRDAFEEIVEFSGLGSFIDLPVKTYSSGMVGRLVFSVATAFKPDVLLMDEWLSTGDAEFITKAEQRVSSLVASARCMVLASHSQDIMRRFCNKLLVLEHGEVVHFGPTPEVLGRLAA